MYFTFDGQKVIVLLCGGDKSDQRKDINAQDDTMLTIKKGKQTKSAPAASWEKTIIQLLRNDPEFAATYLLDCLREENPNIFLRALNDVITAYGGFSAFARLTGMNRTNLHRALSADGNPTWSNLQPILQSLGIELSLNPKKSNFIKTFPKPDKKPVTSEKVLRTRLKKSA